MCLLLYLIAKITLTGQSVPFVLIPMLILNYQLDKFASLANGLAAPANLKHYANPVSVSNSTLTILRAHAYSVLHLSVTVRTALQQLHLWNARLVPRHTIFHLEYVLHAIVPV